MIFIKVLIKALKCDELLVFISACFLILGIVLIIGLGVEFIWNL